MKMHCVTAMTVIAFFMASNHAKADMYVLSGVMDVFQATTNPGNVGSGSGNISGTYDDVTGALNYNLDWTPLTTAITTAHFHVGAPGVAGGVALAIPGPWTSPYSNSAVLDATQEAGLLSGNWYVNIHTTMFPGGEIRGQVSASAVPEPGTAMFGLLAFAGLGLRRRKTVA